MTLFTPSELQAWLQYEIEDATALVAERVVAGWLSEATGLSPFPDPLPAVLFSWALELGGIAYENPTSQTDDQAQQVRTAWSDRRSQILASARRWVSAPSGARAATRPSGAYAPALGWPDGAVRPQPYPAPSVPGRTTWPPA